MIHVRGGEGGINGLNDGTVGGLGSESTSFLSSSSSKLTGSPLIGTNFDLKSFRVRRFRFFNLLGLCVVSLFTNLVLSSTEGLSKLLLPLIV